MSKSEDLKASINGIDRVLKSIEAAELEFKASVDSSAVTINTLGLNSILGLSSQTFKDLKDVLKMNRSALEISQKRQ